jgi:hypothetical protein
MNLSRPCLPPLLTEQVQNPRLLSTLLLLRNAWKKASDFRLPPEELTHETQDLLSLTLPELCRLIGKIRLLAALVERESALPPEVAGPVLLERKQPPRCLPHWDGEKRLLLWQERIVKSFRVPAPNQELILASLEEEGWPEQVDDLLPVAHAIDPKARLHDTIKGLNRNQVHGLLRFVGDGTGRRVGWRLREAGR